MLSAMRGPMSLDGGQVIGTGLHQGIDAAEGSRDFPALAPTKRMPRQRGSPCQADALAGFNGFKRLSADFSPKPSRATVRLW